MSGDAGKDSVLAMIRAIYRSDEFKSRSRVEQLSIMNIIIKSQLAESSDVSEVDIHGLYSESIWNKESYPTYVYHLTTIDGLYAILESGYIRPRKKTGAEVVLSPATSRSSSGNYAYVSLNSTLPSPGKTPVQLVLSSSLLYDRKDYHLNYEWSYGKLGSSLSSNHLEEFLHRHNPLYSEIIFESGIAIDPYLVGINIAQMPLKISNMIPPEHRLPTVNLNRVAGDYRKLIKIIEK